MARNVEIKARLRDRGAAEELARSVSDAGPETIDQEDVFFRVPDGKLKLRIFSAAEGELIHYRKPRGAEPVVSDYTIARTDAPGRMRSILKSVLPAWGVVRKRRILYICGRTRIHLDSVDGLGDFIELECVLDDGQETAEGHEILSGLMRALRIGAEDLVDRSYIDLITEGR